MSYDIFTTGSDKSEFRFYPNRQKKKLDVSIVGIGMYV